MVRYQKQQTQQADLLLVIKVPVDWDKLKIKLAAMLTKQTPESLVSITEEIKILTRNTLSSLI